MPNCLPFVDERSLVKCKGSAAGFSFPLHPPPPVPLFALASCVRATCPWLSLSPAKRKRKRLLRRLLWKWSWSLTRGGRLQEVRNIVNWLGNFWLVKKTGHWGEIVTYERWSRPKVGLYLQNKRTRSCIKEWLIRKHNSRPAHLHSTFLKIRRNIKIQIHTIASIFIIRSGLRKTSQTENLH